MPFHESNSPDAMARYLQEEEVRLRKEAETSQTEEGLKVPETERKELSAPLQIDLLEEAESWLGNKSQEELAAFAYDTAAKEKLAQEKLVGRETQIDDLIRFFVERGGASVASQNELTRPEAQRLQFLE